VSAVPAGWTSARLGDVATIITGSTPPTADQSLYGGSIPFVKPPHLRGESVPQTEQTISVAGLRKTRTVGEGATLVSCIGALGKTALTTEMTAFNQQINAIVFHPQIRPKFGFYACQRLKPYLHSVASATTIPIVNKSKLSEATICFPNTNEQDRIVAEIEKQFTRIEAGVASLRAARRKASAYRRSLLRLVVDPDKWPTRNLGDVLIDIESGASFKCIERPPAVGEFGVVKISAVTWGTYDEDESKTCLPGASLDDQLLIKSGDFLFSRANTLELVGACVIANQVDRRVMLSDKVLRFRFEGVEPRWVLHCLRSPVGRRQIESLASGNQLSMRNIGQDRIKRIALPFPPLDIQRTLADDVENRLNAAARLVSECIDSSIKRSQQLRQATLSRAFLGTLLQPTESTHV
jgi:type I restriction enzyme S subunit